MSAWDNVKQQLTIMTALLEAPADSKRLYAFADAFTVLASAYHTALKSEGKSSIRMQAVEKALNLKTGKTALQTFVGDG